jgi:hypothetical protein
MKKIAILTVIEIIPFGYQIPSNKFPLRFKGSGQPFSGKIKINNNNMKRNNKSVLG